MSNLFFNLLKNPITSQCILALLARVVSSRHSVPPSPRPPHHTHQPGPNVWGNRNNSKTFWAPSLPPSAANGSNVNFTAQIGQRVGIVMPVSNSW